MFLTVRTREDAAAAAPRVRAAIASVDPAIPFSDVVTMEQRRERSTSRDRTSMMLVGTLAGIALLLGVVGLYGVLSFGLAQRMREFGVRAALGASPGSIRWLVLRKGLMLMLAGAIVGTAGAAVLARAMRSMLHGATTSDPGPYAVGLAVIAAASAIAFWRPTRRAGHADPSVVLRSE
jgi:ABC-type antimicrobial peptide transport system permease subunit